MSAIVLLRGITHVLITTAPTKEQSMSSRVIATVDLCFGPGDENCISGIDYVLNAENQTTWKMPSIGIVRDGKPINVPIFKGLLAEEISKWAASSLLRVQKEIGKPKFGKIYRIPTGNASKVEMTVVEPKSQVKAKPGHKEKAGA